MKKLVFAIFCILGLISLSSCELDLFGEANDSITTDNFKQIQENYRTKTSTTITEKTSIILLNDEKIESERITNVDLDSLYTYADISCGDMSGYLYQTSTLLYTSYNNKKERKEFEMKDIYTTLGFSSLFYYEGFRLDSKTAKANISSPEIMNYTVLFENVLFEIQENFNYNPSILPIEITIEKEKIKEIDFDLSLVFGSYIKSGHRKVTFDDTAFEKKEVIVDENLAKEYLVSTEDTLETYVLEMVYQYGDAIYIKSGDFDMLIDAGQYNDGENVDKILKEKCIDHTLDVLIATHGHADHLGGFGGGALNSIEKINLIIDFGYVDDGAYAYTITRNNFIEKGSDYFSADDCVKYKNGASKFFKFSDDLSLEVLDTKQYAETGQTLTKTQLDAENDFSVVVLLTFKENRYLFTGDLAGQLGNRFTSALKKENIKDVMVYKAAHHGANSYSTNNTEFINYINPEICVSSAAIVNQQTPGDHSLNGQTVYQHPRPGFVRWILNTPKISKTKNYYFNGTMGTIHLIDNGIDIPTVEGLGATRGYYILGEKVTGEENKKFYDTQMYQSFYKN